MFSPMSPMTERIRIQNEGAEFNRRAMMPRRSVSLGKFLVLLHIARPKAARPIAAQPPVVQPPARVTKGA